MEGVGFARHGGGKGRKTIGEYGPRRKVQSIRDGSSYEFPPISSLQLFARATLIKQDNLLSNRALPDMAVRGKTGQNAERRRSRVHILMIRVRPGSRSPAENIIPRMLREGRRISD